MTATIQIALVSRTIFYAPVWMAEQNGYFRDEGIDPRFDIFDNAEKINEVMRAARRAVRDGPLRRSELSRRSAASVNSCTSYRRASCSSVCACLSISTAKVSSSSEAAGSVSLRAIRTNPCA
jgi:hypothetical protein